MAGGKYLSDYATALRAAVYGLWAERIYDTDFIGMVEAALFRYLPLAYEEGAASLGIRKDEITDAERNTITVLLFQQLTYIPGWAAFVQAHNKSSGTLLGALAYRTTLWVNAYNRFYTLGQISARNDPKLIWRLGPTKDHCHDCSRIAGKVKRRSQWEASGWRPQGSNLECRGYHCKCEWEVTTEPMSKGRLPIAP